MVNTKKKPEKNKAPIKEETLRALNRMAAILSEIAQTMNPSTLLHLILLNTNRLLRSKNQIRNRGKNKKGRYR